MTKKTSSRRICLEEVFVMPSGAALYLGAQGKQGYQLCGDVYEDDLVEELLLSQTALSVARLTARVEKMER